MKNKFIYLAVLAAGFASCEPEFENEVNANYTAGDADFSTYVAVGNSLTAGYMDGTVSRVGQTYSFPNLLAQKFALVGGGEFTQPSYADDVNNLGIRIYPSPAENNLTILLQNKENAFANVEIFNINGILVKHFKLENRKTIDISDFFFNIIFLLF